MAKQLTEAVSAGFTQHGACLRLPLPPELPLLDLKSPTEFGQQPFFAMELIEHGLPLDRFADERKLDLRARLELFARV
jgi:hypothetical protein